MQEQQSEIVKSIEHQQQWNNDVELAIGLAKESQESLGYELKLISDSTQSAILQTDRLFGKWSNDVEMVLGRAKENEESLGYDLQLVLDRTRSAEEGLKELQSQVHALKPAASETANFAKARPQVRLSEATKPPQHEKSGSHGIPSDLGSMFHKDGMVSFAYSRKGPLINVGSQSRLPWEGCAVCAAPQPALPINASIAAIRESCFSEKS